MRLLVTIGGAVTIVTLWLGLGALAQSAWAQSPSGPTPAATDGGTVVMPAMILFVLVLAVIIGVAKLQDHRHAREGEAVTVQAQLSEALLRDPRLAKLPITVTVSMPLWKRSPGSLEVRGEVPSPELHQAILHVIAEELSACCPDIHVDDRITVLQPAGTARAA